MHSVTMTRVPEQSVRFKAGVLSIGVHGVLLALLLLSVNWQTQHVSAVAEVELWDSLPAPEVVNPARAVKVPVPAKAVPPEPTPVNVPTPTPETKPDIVLEKKPEQKIEPPKEKKAEPPKKVIEKNQEPAPPKDLLKALEEIEQKEALKAIQADGVNELSQPKKSQASAGEVDQHKAAIMRKIQANVNKALCGSGNPTLTFDITLTPTGDLQTAPKLVKPSGMNACDEAVERAILQSQPLPLPTDAMLRLQFKNLTLKFSPNQ